MQRPAARVLDAVVLDAEPRRPRIEYSGIGAEARVLDSVVLDGRGAARVLDAVPMHREALNTAGPPPAYSFQTFPLLVSPLFRGTGSSRQV